jgi:hypothetical protein
MMAVLSVGWPLTVRTLNPCVQISFRAWMSVLVFLHCAVLGRQRPCDELITRPRVLPDVYKDS